MNTFTFTDDEVEVIESALRQYTHNLSSFNKLLIDSGIGFEQINKNMALATEALKSIGRTKEK